MSHTPVAALPGAQMLLQDPAGQAVAAQVFGRRSASAHGAALVDINEQFRVPAAFLNSWANFGGAYNPAGFWKDKSGVVHLRGLIASGVIGSAAFTLPVGYRPANTEFGATQANAAFATYRVLNTGDVVPFSGSNAYFALDGITFRAA